MSFSLFGKVGLDVSGFYKGMNQMKVSAAPLGKQVGEQMRGAILGAVGAGALVSGVKAALKRAFDIRRDSTKLGISEELYQTLKVVADQTGVSVETMVEQMNAGTEAGKEFAAAVEALNAQLLQQNAILDGDNVKKLAGYQDKLDALTSKLGVGFGWLAGVAGDVMDAGTKAASLAASGGMNLWGRMTGNKSLVQAGQEMAYETVNEKTDQTDAAMTTAKAMAIEFARQAKATPATGSTAADKVGRPFAPKVYAEGMAQYGPALKSTTAENQLKLIHRTLVELLGTTREGVIR